MKRNIFIPLCLFILQSISAQTTNFPVVKIQNGLIRGNYENGIYNFKGIPYGENTSLTRFQPPLPKKSWEGILDCRHYGPIAYQATAPQKNYEKLQQSEDCLNLNIWTPALNHTILRPVVVWFHGGAYSNGTSNDPLVDGTELAKKGNVVVVTVNHRLNIFGYLYLAQFDSSRYKYSGNVGMLDLVLALQWIQSNIKFFSGDSSNITIIGQSGGGAKCATLMGMPAASGLFHKVLTMSGQQLTGRKKEAATKTAIEVIQILNISPDSLKQLEKIPPQQLLTTIKGKYFGPVTDGVAHLRDPFDPDASPLTLHIPMIMGNTRFETTSLIGLGDTITFNLEWEDVPQKVIQHVQQFIGNLKADSLVQLYRQWYPHFSPSDVFFAITTAARSWRSMIIQAERRARYAHAPTYVYLFDWNSPVNNYKLRSAHGMDIPFFFNNTENGKHLIGEGEEQKQLASIMSDVLIAFAYTGSPQTHSLPLWETFSLDRYPTMVFRIPPSLEFDPRKKERELFAPIPYIQPGTL